jgi:hypothetical protein
MQAMKDWYQEHPHLFHKRPYDRPGYDTYSKDSAKFQRIYRLFETSKDATPSPSAEELYERFKSVMKPRTKKVAS